MHRVLYFHLLRVSYTSVEFSTGPVVCPCVQLVLPLIATTKPGYGTFTILYILRPRHTTRAYNGYNFTVQDSDRTVAHSTLHGESQGHEDIDMDMAHAHVRMHGMDMRDSVVGSHIS
jgi:hypothetical protein